MEEDKKIILFLTIARGPTTITMFYYYIILFIILFIIYYNVVAYAFKPLAPMHSRAQLHKLI